MIQLCDHIINDGDVRGSSFGRMERVRETNDELAGRRKELFRLCFRDEARCLWTAVVRARSTIWALCPGGTDRAEAETPITPTPTPSDCAILARPRHGWHWLLPLVPALPPPLQPNALPYLPHLLLNPTPPFTYTSSLPRSFGPDGSLSLAPDN